MINETGLKRTVDRVIHDTNSVCARQSAFEAKIDKWLKSLPPEIHIEYNTAIPYTALEYLKTERKKLRDLVDLLWDRYKKDFEYDL